MSAYNFNQNSKLSDNFDPARQYYDTRTLNCFLKLKIKKKEKVQNPDIENKIKEGRYKIKNYIKNNFKVWDGYNNREINIHQGRVPSPLSKMMQGMKSHFFGENGKITKRVPVLKNGYLREQNNKIRKMKILNLNANSENNRSSIAPNFLRLKLSDFLKDIPPEERKDLIKKTGLAFKRDEKGRRGGILNAKNMKPLVSVDFEAHLKADTSDSFESISSDSVASNTSPDKNVPNLKYLNNLVSGTKNKSAKSKTDRSASRMYKSNSQPDKLKIENIPHTNHSRNFPLQSELTSRPCFNRLTSTTFATKTLSPTSRLFRTQSQSQLEINSKLGEINSGCYKLDKDFSTQIRKFKSPLEKKRKKITDEIDKEVVIELNQKFLKNKKDIRESGGIGLSAVKVRGQFQNIDSCKANLIKIADNISKMNEVTALYLADKLAKEYESNAVNAAVDEAFEFKKNHNNEMIVKCSNIKMNENNRKMKQLHYNIFQKNNKIKQMIESFKIK